MLVRLFVMLVLAGAACSDRPADEGPPEALAASGEEQGDGERGAGFVEDGNEPPAEERNEPRGAPDERQEPAEPEVVPNFQFTEGRAAGDPCGERGPHVWVSCEAPLVCDAGRGICVSVANESEPCGSSTTANCAPGLSCIDGRCRR